MRSASIGGTPRSAAARSSASVAAGSGSATHAALPRNAGGFPQLRDDVLVVVPHELFEPVTRDDELAALAVDVAQMRLGRDDAFEAGIRSRGYLRRHAGQRMVHARS